jgi:hypothetical protein
VGRHSWRSLLNGLPNAAARLVLPQHYPRNDWRSGAFGWHSRARQCRLALRTLINNNNSPKRSGRRGSASAAFLCACHPPSAILRPGAARLMKTSRCYSPQGCSNCSPRQVLCRSDYENPLELRWPRIRFVSGLPTSSTRCTPSTSRAFRPRGGTTGRGSLRVVGAVLFRRHRLALALRIGRAVTCAFSRGPRRGRAGARRRISQGPRRGRS